MTLALSLPDDHLAEEVVGHLLATRPAGDAELARYHDRLIELAGLEAAEHRALHDPFDRSVALVFSLVREADMDPWAVDLAAFIRLFSARLETTEGIDLPSCGRLLRLAWEVLHGQAEHVLHHHDDPDEVWEDDLSFLDTGDWSVTADDEAYEFNLNVISGRARPHLPALLSERLRRDPGRTVTLAELLSGLAEAEEAAAGRARREAARRDWAERVEHALSNVRSRLHTEDLEGDVARTWHALRRLAAGRDVPVEMDAIVDHLTGTLAEEAPGDDPEALAKEAHIMGFVSLLFLARRGLVEVWQTELAEGPVRARDLWPEAPDYGAARQAAGLEDDVEVMA